MKNFHFQICRLKMYTTLVVDVVGEGLGSLLISLETGVCISVVVVVVCFGHVPIVHFSFFRFSPFPHSSLFGDVLFRVHLLRHFLIEVTVPS